MLPFLGNREHKNFFMTAISVSENLATSDETHPGYVFKQVDKPSLKETDIRILGFAGHASSVGTTQACLCSTNAATGNARMMGVRGANKTLFKR